jgi:serine protease Do
MASVGILMPTLVHADEAADEAEAYRHAQALSKAFRAAAKRVLPTVVTVETTAKPRPTNHQPSRNPLQGTPWEDLFDDRPPGLGGESPQGAQPNFGSGVIVDPSGVVLTNNHVVSGADGVTIQLSDGRRFQATDVKVDDKSDLAVVRIETKEPLPAAKLGDSDKLEIGDWVLAIGNPYELERTVSAGIISAKGRSLAAVGRSNYLQTDAAINPGNSGGPLVNLAGEIVGINTAIFSRSGGNQGIGFAIPSNVARWVVPQLVKKGTVQRAYLGVALERMTAERAARMGTRDLRGVVVAKVFPNSPAAAAGIREDDILLDIDGQALHEAADLQQIVERSTANSQHQLNLIRDGKPQSLSVTLQAMPESFGAAGFAPPREDGDTPSQLYRQNELGIVVADVTPRLAEELGLRGATGVALLHVEPESIAYRAGLRKGMQILQVGGKPVGNVAEFSRQMESQSLDNGITLQLATREGNQTVTLRRS